VTTSLLKVGAFNATLLGLQKLYAPGYPTIRFSAEQCRLEASHSVNLRFDTGFRAPAYVEDFAPQLLSIACLKASIKQLQDL